MSQKELLEILLKDRPSLIEYNTHRILCVATLNIDDIEVKIITYPDLEVVTSIDSLHEYFINENDIKSVKETDYGNPCPICLDDLKSPSNDRLKCGHRVHKMCFYELSKTKEYSIDCPICNQ